MSRRDVPSNFDAMLSQSEHPWKLWCRVPGGPVALAMPSLAYALPPAAEIAASAATVPRTVMVRRETGPGWKPAGTSETVFDIYEFLYGGATTSAAA